MSLSGKISGHSWPKKTKFHWYTWNYSAKWLTISCDCSSEVRGAIIQPLSCLCFQLGWNILWAVPRQCLSQSEDVRQVIGGTSSYSVQNSVNAETQKSLFNPEDTQSLSRTWPGWLHYGWWYCFFCHIYLYFYAAQWQTQPHQASWPFLQKER